MVTQSNGNGFALYNGVKLPNIDSVWTDKASRPFAFLCYDNLGVPLLYLSEGSPFLSGSRISVHGFFDRYLLVDGAWSYITTAGGSFSTSVRPSEYLFWSFSDIVTSGSSGDIYFAASIPIPLDGMNVIEWDGDTEGLPEYGGYIRICDYISVDSVFGVYANASDSPLFSENITYEYIPLTGTVTDNYWLLESTVPRTYANSEDCEELSYLPSAGIWCSGNKKMTGSYVSLIAYTPRSVTPAFDRTTFLSGLTMGLTGKGVPELSGKCLYNGVELPGLPDVDAPYKVITLLYGGWLFFGSDYEFMAKQSSAGISVSPSSLSVPLRYELLDGVWVETSAAETGPTVGGFTANDGLTWANHDVYLYSWGGYGQQPEPLDTIFISASDPIPVEQDVFYKGYLLGAELRNGRPQTKDVLDNTLPIRWSTADVADNTKVLYDEAEFVRVSSLCINSVDDAWNMAGVLSVTDGEETVFAPMLFSKAAGDGVWGMSYFLGETSILAYSVPRDNLEIGGVTIPKKGLYVQNLDEGLVCEFMAAEKPVMFFDKLPFDMKFSLSSFAALDEVIPLIQEDGAQNGSIVKISNLTPSLEELNSTYNTEGGVGMIDGVLVEAPASSSLTWSWKGDEFVHNNSDNYWVVYEEKTIHTTVFDNASVALTAHVTPGIYLSDRTVFGLVLTLAALLNSNKNGNPTDDMMRMCIGTAEQIEQILAEYN